MHHTHSYVHLSCDENSFLPLLIVKDDIINKILCKNIEKCAEIVCLLVCFFVCRFVFCAVTMHLPNNEWSNLKYSVRSVCANEIPRRRDEKKEPNRWRCRFCLCRAYFIGYSILSPFATRYHHCKSLNSLNITAKIFLPKLNTWTYIGRASISIKFVEYHTQKPNVGMLRPECGFKQNRHFVTPLNRFSYTKKWTNRRIFVRMHTKT